MKLPSPIVDKLKCMGYDTHQFNYMNRLNSIYRSSLAALSVAGFMVSVGLTPASQVLATDVPSFPQCTDKIGTNGDWSSQPGGTHHIPGQEAPIEGKDDVYFVSNDNFLQCLCPLDGQGVQTVWWNVDGMNENKIASFVAKGWYLLNGSDWNLLNHKYLAKNSNYSCKTVTPTPTLPVTPTPTKPLSTPTPTRPHTPPSCPDVKLDVPVLLSVNKSGNDGVELIWSQPDANVEYYMISYGYESGKYNFGVPNTGKVTSFRIGSLDLSKKYYFVVRSQKGCNVSEASNELSYPRGEVKAAGLAKTNSNPVINQLLAALAGLALTTWGSVYTYKATRSGK